MEATKDNLPDDGFLDDAAAYALGAQSAAEAGAFSQNLSAATPAQRQAALALQDAAARLAAASPYMEPPNRLRAAILGATAPAAFNIKDYRRAADDQRSRYLRWAMAAAAIGLIWSGYSIMSLRTDNARLSTIAQNQAQQLESEHGAIEALIDPEVHQVNLRNNTNQKIIGKMLVDSRTNEVTLVMPNAVIPPHTKIKLALQQNGRKMELTATAIGASPGSAFVHWRLPQPIDPNKPLDLQLNDGPKIAGTGLQ